MIVITELPVEEALRLLDVREKNIVVEGHRVKTGSQRYALFRSTAANKGLACCSCPRVGVTMRLEKPNNAGKTPHHPADRAHFNLYSADGVMLTKDHILPKSKGGRDVLTNYQTMCAECNHAKGNVTEEIRRVTWDEARFLMIDDGAQARPERCQNLCYEWDGAAFVRYDNGTRFRAYADMPRRHREQGWVIL